MNHVYRPFLGLLIATFLFTAACNLSKDVEIDLPDYDRQPVVECYLEPGKPFRLLLSRSYAYFDNFGLDSNFLANTLLSDAVVTISYDGRTDTLAEQFSLEFAPQKIFNYTGQNLVPAEPGTKFSLRIDLPNGGGYITAETVMLRKVSIDSIKVEFGPEAGDTLARVLTYITDDLGEENFYRRILNYRSLDSFPDQDFIVTDRISQSALIAFGTGYEVADGDTVFNSIYHITKAHYDFQESVELALQGIVNPFAQPSPIKSNVGGTANALGIFAPLVYDRRMTIAKR